MTPDAAATIRNALDAGDTPPFQSLEQLRGFPDAIAVALGSSAGRRWLRSLNDLDASLADHLLTFDDDFHTKRRDRTLGIVVERASKAAILERRESLAAGPAAGAFWGRMAAENNDLVSIASPIVSSGGSEPAINTLYLLVLDTLDVWNIGAVGRAAIARAGLGAEVTAVRSLAAEYLFDHDVPSLASLAPDLVLDSDERVRGLAWSAGFRVNPGETFELATGIAGDESAPLPVRRSALAALGTHFQTSDLVDLLTFFVTHPDEQLALDAGNLLYRLHRHPTIATAAANSPHQSVREIGEFLLDPFRGSPAAGGSRPGDPNASDIFAELIRKTGEDNRDENG